jgi:hypothetical protein
MADWTRERVEERLIEAAEVMKRLPPVRVQGYFSVWPAILPEFGDLVGREPPRLRRPAPAPDAIDRMEAAMPWLRWLEPEDAKLVWARAEGTPWKPLCWRFGVSRATACRHWEAQALARVPGRPRSFGQRAAMERLVGETLMKPNPRSGRAHTILSLARSLNKRKATFHY